MHFLKEFLYKNRKKGKSYLQVMMWRARPGDELTRRTGPPRGCNSTLRPRDRAMGGPREAQEAHRAWPRGRGPRVHADSRGCPCAA